MIHTLSPDERDGLPTHDLLPEKDFSHFEVTKQRNRKFTATILRNDMTMLHSTSRIALTQDAQKSVDELKAREQVLVWNEQQR